MLNYSLLVIHSILRIKRQHLNSFFKIICCFKSWSFWLCWKRFVLCGVLLFSEMFIPDQQEDMWLKCYKNMVQDFLSCKHGLQYKRTISIYMIYIKLQPKTWLGNDYRVYGVYSQSLVLWSIVLGWILIYNISMQNLYPILV